MPLYKNFIEVKRSNKNLVNNQENTEFPEKPMFILSELKQQIYGILLMQFWKTFGKNKLPCFPIP